MKILEYVSFEEKSKVYAHADLGLKINTHLLIEDLEKSALSGHYIYRGVSEAKFKMYNSAQRYWLENELYYQSLMNDQVGYQDCYNSFIDSMINTARCWNGGTIAELFSKMGISSENSLAYLSFMQHYGIPSPLLDFSFDPFIALFFAIQNVSLSASSKQIENYFSLYCINTENPMVGIWKEHFNSNMLVENKFDFSYSKIASNILPLVIIPSDDSIYQTTNNVNIINQKGVFVYNNHATQPLGEVFFDFFNALNDVYGFQNSTENGELFCMCYNIHKSLIPEIVEVLNSKGITHARMFPDFYQIKDFACYEATRHIIKIKNSAYRPQSKQ
ncbi:MAG: hypothetical protein BGO21_25835 [Dyadobacter sp. 50-39]|uniref:FRG domain-containing protein n=1 Tax=Dyadobacter sp. 50-39 TaxID=1895756 RepID=UPI00095E6CD1|nr:FRG domain-containing protein [Dyadobacter sp. 50-39]OJV17311.1 MAG: hypothetical protein BGO21_25835 [Dyadobacter sp. 50-39]